MAYGPGLADRADLKRITDAILTGRLTVPIAGTFAIERIRDAVALQPAGPSTARS